MNEAEIKRIKRRIFWWNFIKYGFMIFISAPIILFYSWLFIGAFKGKHGFTLHNWRFLWEKTVLKGLPNIWGVTLNTLILAGGVALFTILVATLGGYALSRLEFKGRGPLLGFTLALHAFPSITLLVAIFYILRTLGLLNTLGGVILVKVALELPFATWVMKGFYDSIPWDIEISAIVDGASRFQTWFKVMLPLAKPGIGALSIFSFLSGWSEFVFVYTFILNEKAWTLSTYLKGIIGEFRFVDYGLLTAVSVFYMIPTLIFFIFAQKHLLKITMGGVKGA